MYRNNNNMLKTKPERFNVGKIAGLPKVQSYTSNRVVYVIITYGTAANQSLKITVRVSRNLLCDLNH